MASVSRWPQPCGSTVASCASRFQLGHGRYWSAVGGHCQRQFAGQLQSGDLLDRHQVFVEVLELARTLHRDITRSAARSSAPTGRITQVTPVDAVVGQNQLRPARLDECGWRIGGHLARAVAVHAAACRWHRAHPWWWRSPQFEHAQELRRVAA